jgi:hypothetical protein
MWDDVGPRRDRRHFRGNERMRRGLDRTADRRLSGERARRREAGRSRKPAPIKPNETTEFKYGLHGQTYTFKKGHRIMVQLQSTWFPIIDRNPQTFVPNIFEAKAEDYRAATPKIFRSAKLASHLVLPVFRGGSRSGMLQLATKPWELQSGVSTESLPRGSSPGQNVG